MSRVQLALNVENLEAAVECYSKLFDTAPAKRRDGYANFAVANPPLKLVLFEQPGRGGTINHLGVEVDDTKAVGAAQARLAGEGLATASEEGVACCYARQDKGMGGRTVGRAVGDLHASRRCRDAWGPAAHG